MASRTLPHGCWLLVASTGIAAPIFASEQDSTSQATQEQITDVSAALANTDPNATPDHETASETVEPKTDWLGWSWVGDRWEDDSNGQTLLGSVQAVSGDFRLFASRATHSGETLEIDDMYLFTPEEQVLTAPKATVWIERGRMELRGHLNTRPSLTEQETRLSPQAIDVELHPYRLTLYRLSTETGPKPATRG